MARTAAPIMAAAPTGALKGDAALLGLGLGVVLPEGLLVL